MLCTNLFIKKVLPPNKILFPMFDFLERCKGVEQKEEYHPEIDVFDHSIQVMNLAFRECNDVDLILAAMLHDVGKYENSIGHEKIAVKWLDDLCSGKTLWLIENHMRFWYFVDGQMRKLKKVNLLTNHPWFPELALLARWDKIGRKKGVRIKYSRIDIIKRLALAVKQKFEGI